MTDTKDERKRLEEIALIARTPEGHGWLPQAEWQRLLDVQKARTEAAERRADARDQRIAELEQSAGFWGRATSRAFRKRDEQKRRADALERALKRLSFAAQTTGGTAGPDQGLQDAIAEAERVLAQQEPDQPTYSDKRTGSEIFNDVSGKEAFRIGPDGRLYIPADQPAQDGGRKSNDNGPGHDLYKTGDVDAPDVIKDGNGEVALGLCRKCGRGEIELTEPCDQPAAAGEPSCCVRTREAEREAEEGDQ
jgi:hypothetical protein